MNVIIADKIESSREVIFSYLKNMENINILGSFADFQFEFADLNQIDLIIFDISSSNLDEMLEKVEKLKAKKPTLDFIATSYEINTELVSKTLKSGHIKDFLLKPLIPNVFEIAIKKISETKKENYTKTKTLCFFSNKSGSGKTSCAVNIAYEIAQKTQQKVCLLDLTMKMLGNKEAIEQLKKNISDNMDSAEALLLENGYPGDYLNEIFV